MIDQLPLPKVGDPIKAEHIAAITRAISKRTPRNSTSVKVHELADGFYLEAAPGRSSSTFKGAWYPSREAANLLNLTAGLLYDGVTTHFPQVTNITIHPEALRYIYLVCTLTPTTVDGFVTGGTVNATPVITAYSSTQTNTNTTAYILLFTWQAGALLQRYAYWNMACQLRNVNTGDVSFQHWVCS